MAIEELSNTQIDQLAGSRHAVVGFEYPPSGLQPYYQWLMRTLHRLAEVSAGHWKVDRDAGGPTVVRVAPGRACLAGRTLVYQGGTLDLSEHNNQTMCLWLADEAGQAQIAAADENQGWPVQPHLKLAQVRLEAGQITDIVDRRLEALFQAGWPAGAIEAEHLSAALGAALATYALNLVSQGDTGTPSAVSITLRDLQGQPLAEVDHLRVRLCEQGAYSPATHAALAAAGDTTVVQELVAGKDLVLRSDAQGVFELSVSNAVAETVTLRLGPAPLGTRRGDYQPVLHITHA